MLRRFLRASQIAALLPPAAGNSLIFTSASSQRLTSTGKTSINQQKFTFACWFKSSSSAAVQTFWYVGDGTASNRITVTLGTAGGISVAGATGGSAVLVLSTTATGFNDGNWHSLVFAVDTTQATAGNRCIIYVDGSVLALSGSPTIPAQNTNLSNNFAATYDIGSNQTPANFFNGKLAQIYYIDGQQLTPTSFITGTPGIPKTYSGAYSGTFDYFLPFSNGASTVTLGADGSGEGNNWTLNNMTTANQSTDYP